MAPAPGSRYIRQGPFSNISIDPKDVMALPRLNVFVWCRHEQDPRMGLLFDELLKAKFKQGFRLKIVRFQCTGGRAWWAPLYQAAAILKAVVTVLENIGASVELEILVNRHGIRHAWAQVGKRYAR